MKEGELKISKVTYSMTDESARVLEEYCHLLQRMEIGDFNVEFKLGIWDWCSVEVRL